MNKADELSTVRKLLMTAAFVLFACLSAMADNVSKVVTLTKAGTLSNRITDDEKYTITCLKVSGPINGADILCLREMAGNDVDGKATNGKLAELDLTDATIVASDDIYQNEFNAARITENNVIGEYAFYLCSQLTSIKLPNTVTSIGNSALLGCSNLSSVTIPNSVTSIERSAFRYCSNLSSVTIPNSVTSINSTAFALCPSLSSIKVEDGNSYYHADGNCLIETASNTLIRGCGIGSIVIPNSVTSIGCAAFSGCTGLTSVTIPNSVTSIERQAFYGCTGLSSVAISNSVTNIGELAFSTCTSLSSVTIPNSVTIIGDGAFIFCSSLTSVTIPKSVTSIGWWAYKKCTSLTSVTICSDMTSIGYSSFFGCTALKDVTLLGENLPVECYDDAFDSIYADATLYCDAALIDTCRNTEPWSYFKNIVTKPIPTNISGLVMEGIDGKPAVYDIYGRRKQRLSKGLNIVDGKKLHVR